MARISNTLLAIVVLGLAIRQLLLLDTNNTELFPEHHLDVIRPSGVRAALVYDSEHLLHVVHLRVQSLHPQNETHRPCVLCQQYLLYICCFHSLP